MIRKFKFLFVIALGAFLLQSCNKSDNGPYYYESFAVLDYSFAGDYFLLDDGLAVLPSKTINLTDFNVGDRLLVSFSLDRLITSDDTEIKAEIMGVAKIPAQNVIDYTSDSLNIGRFFYNDLDPNGALCANSYLTTWVKVPFSDPAKRHTFGFMYDETYSRNDTVFLRMWHNANGDGNLYVQSNVLFAVKLETLPLSGKDSAVIAIKYASENSAGLKTDRTMYAKYKKSAK